MLIKSSASLYSLFLSIILLGCDGNEEEMVTPNQPPLLIPFTELDGDLSDIDVKPAFSWDIEVYGNLLMMKITFTDLT